MERLQQQPFRGFTLAQAVELFHRLSAANDDRDRVRDPPRPRGRLPVPPAMPPPVPPVAPEAPPSAA